MSPVRKGRGTTVYVCQQCGNESTKWQGRCSFCGEWNTLTEFSVEKSSASNPWLNAAPSQVEELAHVSLEDQARLSLPFDEVNRVLGGGLVPGSLILVAGEPGIGKSTLLLQLASAVAQDKGKVAYVSGEESGPQVKLRAQRLGISGEGLYFLTTAEVGEALAHLDKLNPALAVVDSIQTMYTQSLPSGPGTVMQIRECTRLLMQWAKAKGIPVLLTGHVTKGGDVAGPRVLEHMVDVVLYMEGEPISSLRLLRSIKNRFGSTNEVGVFEMGSTGLLEVSDPSRVFLSEHREGAIGSAILPTLEGSRPLMVEVQALTSPSALPTPRRIANGVDFNRLLLVSAVLTQRVGLPLSGQDIIVNVAGGLRIGEPAADLGIALAIASSFRNSPLHPSLVAIGEVGLSGEVRRIPQMERRIGEAARLGFTKCLIPANAKEGLPGEEGLELVPVGTLSQALRLALPRHKSGSLKKVDESHNQAPTPDGEEQRIDLESLAPVREE